MTSARRLADVVVPIALAVKRGQLAHELWHYKYDVDATVRRRLAIRLGCSAVAFSRPARGARSRGSRRTAVRAPSPLFPGPAQRDDEHPLVRIVGTLVGQTERYEPLLTPGLGASGHRRTVLADRYRADAGADGPSRRPADRRHVDDGRPAQSAASHYTTPERLRSPWVVLGRHFDRSFRNCEAYYQQTQSPEIQLGHMLPRNGHRGGVNIEDEQHSYSSWRSGFWGSSRSAGQICA